WRSNRARKVPGREARRFLFVVRDQAVGNRGRLIYKALDRDKGRLRTGAVGAGIIAVAPVETIHELSPSQRACALGSDQLAHVFPPNLTFIRAAEFAEIVQRA